MTYSKDDIRWAYQYYLGREPESADAIARHIAIPQIDKFMFSSNERKKAGINHFRADEFCCWRPGRPKIIVLSSCQGPALARVIASIADVSVFGCAVVKTRNQSMAEHVLELMDGADFILTAPITAAWHPFDEDSLRQRFGERLLSYHRPYFEAIHPDLVYLQGSNIKSPLEDYHSHLVIDSFQSGLPENQCIERFNGRSYLDFGYRDKAEASIRNLKKKDERVDIKISEWVLETMKIEPILYTINHAMPILQEYIASRFLEKIGVSYRKMVATLTPTVLSSNVIWPIDEEWSEIMGMKFSTDNVYWINNFMMPLEDFVMRSYALYNEAKLSSRHKVHISHELQ